MKKLVIGTRGSELALWQAHHVRDRLLRRFRSLEIELRIIKTTGDKILGQALSTIGDKGLFTKEIEHALLERRIDLAVHSMKDLPTFVPKGLAIAAITKREDVRDVLISKKWKSLEDLPDGAMIATGSLRRRSQLLHLRPDVQIVDIRGNLNTRMKKFDASKWDGMILAHAGVKRLGWTGRIAQLIPTELILPAVGQGALAIEIREDDYDTQRVVNALHHEETAAGVLAERALLRELEGGCQIPIGAYGRLAKHTLILDAVVGSVDGIMRLDARASTGNPRRAEALGKRLAKRLLANGAEGILQDIRRETE